MCVNEIEKKKNTKIYAIISDDNAIVFFSAASAYKISEYN